MSASTLGWGRGWPDCPRDRIVTAVVGERGLRLPVRRELVPLVAGLVADLEQARARPFRPDWSWGFACRPIAGTTRASNHSQGCAVDLDAPENPYTTNASAKHTMPLTAGLIAARWGFRWGGLWRPKRDYMHFEVAVTPLGAAALIADLRALDGRPVAVHPWPWEADVPAPSDVVAAVPIPPELRAAGAGDDAVLKLRCDGTLEYHGANATVASWGHYRRLKPEHRRGDRFFLAEPIVGPDSVACYANDGTRWIFDAGTKPLLQG